MVFFSICSNCMSCIFCYSSHADVKHDNLNGGADEIHAWKNLKFEMKNTTYTTLSEHFQNSIEKSWKEVKSIPQTHKYMTTHFPVLVHALQ